jgi:hypothetical protein
MVVLTMLSLLLAFALVWFAVVVYALGCGAESYSECTPEGRNQLLLALGGIAPALGAVVASVLGRWRPGLWFCATALLYVVWGLYVSHVVNA